MERQPLSPVGTHSVPGVVRRLGAVLSMDESLVELAVRTRRTTSSIPADWDPCFTAWMSRYDVVIWTKKHYDHHRAELTLDVPERPPPGPPG
jgi:hypothetical protein